MQMPVIEITTRPPVTPSNSSSAVRQLQWSCLHEDGPSLVQLARGHSLTVRAGTGHL